MAATGTSLIPALIEIQARHGWIPAAELERLAAEHGRSPDDIIAVASAHPRLRTGGPGPKVLVEVCQDVCCWLADGDGRLAGVRERFAGDDDVEVREVSCVGRCDVAPAADVNGVTCLLADLPGAVERARAGAVRQPLPYSTGRRLPNDPYAPAEERERVFRRMLANDLGPEVVLAALEESGLRGTGGAGFPAWVKWELVRGGPGAVKHVICNGHESEPGAFKDRQIIAEQPHLVLEGILLALAVTGAKQGWVYVRAEHDPETRRLRAELGRLRMEGLLGDNVLGSLRSYEIDVFVSPGGYALGEETVMLENMEGHVPRPRVRPPYPATLGLFGEPTLVNSVETFAAVPIIVEQGPDWWIGQGTNGRAGLKFVAISGDVDQPGVHCVPMGTTMRELIALGGGVNRRAAVLAVQPGGASSPLLGPEALDTPLDWETIEAAGSALGPAALIVYAAGRDLAAVARNVARFREREGFPPL